MVLERFIASSGSAIGNLVLFVGVAMLWPGVPQCSWPGCLATHPYSFALEPTFEPFIVDPGHWDRGGSSEPDCPDPQSRSLSFNLEYSPLPPNFDPFAFPDEKMFACALVGGSGEPLDVRLFGVRDPGMANQLAAAIREEWLFSQSWMENEEPVWVRIRLNRGPMEAAVVDSAVE